MPIRVAIVGCGGISRAHAAAYSHLSSTSLVAVCDNNPDNLQQRADENDVPGRYTDFTEMFEKEKLDLVSICTHAPLHPTVAMAAADAGTHVLSEKPLALDLESADRMIEYCAKAGVKLAVSQQYRFDPTFRLAKQLVDEGRIGTPRLVREIGKGREAGFELMEMGVHYFDEMDFYMGGIEWIHAHATYLGHPVGVEDIMHSSQLCKTDRRDNGLVAGDTMLIQIGGSQGVSGLMELYYRERKEGEGLANWMAGPHLLGDEGQLMIKPNPNTNRDELWYCSSDVSFAAHTPAWEHIVVPEQDTLIEGKEWGRHTIWSVQNMVEAILEDGQPALGGDRAMRSLECISAVYESHFAADRVYLPLSDRRHPLEKRIQDKQ
jgi:predicted dehydrogenase|tara:strand:- start:431 stop:1561 length:1131 start_codon:yes stop_codon:yes gene_type:complete